MAPSATTPIDSGLNNHSTQAPGVCVAKRDVLSSGTRAANGNGVARKQPDRPLSFASVVSSSSAKSAKSPLSTKSLRVQKNALQVHEPAHSPTISSSASASPTFVSSLSDISLGDNNKNGGIACSGFDAGPGDSSATALMSPQSTLGSASPEVSLYESSPRSSGLEGSSNGSGDEGFEEDSESSEVEIYLDTVELDDSASRMHVYSNADTSTGSARHSSAAPSQSQTPVKGQGLHHHSMTTDAEHINSTLSGRNYLTTRDHVPGHQHGQQQEFLQTGASGNHSRGLGVSSIPKNTNSSHYSDETTDSSLSSLATTSVSQSSFPSRQQGLFARHPYQPGSAATVAGFRQLTPLPGAPIHTTIPLPDMDPADRMLQRQHLYGLSHPPLTSSSSSVPSAIEATTIELASLSAPTSGIADLHQSLGQMGISNMMATSHSQPAFVSNHYATNASLDRTSPPSGASHNASFPTSISEPHFGASGSETGTDEDKTPNVYINGLPPHFPEDELFKLANEFGPIRSVRTFTRHVRDSESGYGFVLFENMDDAEQCIISLRKYKNLHPTFSKQIHKIPGTNYATVPSTSSASCWQASASSENLSTSASFKAKMESLHDPTSTNLYLEGLPLSIDEPALSALVDPHRIVSSRFFQTRLSNPPRIIAFVRLETRVGAEQVIERLHGRMVRGLNDTGSRISVRFADTSEQRELRRTERATQEGDVSSSRLTIAQASLLNLRGQDLRPSSKLAASQSQTSLNHTPSTSARGFPASASVPEFSSNAVNYRNDFSNEHLPTGGNNSLEVDYSLGLRRYGVGNLRSPSPYGHQQDFSTHYTHAGYMDSYAHGPSDHSRTLLDSLRTNGAANRATAYASAFGGGEADFYGQGQGYHGVGNGFASSQHGLSHTNVQQLQQQVLASHSLDDLNLRQFVRPSPAYTRTGYTATEEYIMRTQADNGVSSHQRSDQYDLVQQERHRPAPLNLGRNGEVVDSSNQGVGLRGQRSVMSPTSMDHLSGFGHMGISNGARTAGLTEDAFHNGATTATRSRQAVRIARDPGSAPPTMTSMQSAYTATQRNGSSPPLASSSSATDQDQQGSSPAFSPTMSMTSPNPDEVASAYHQASAAHARSTTLPQQRQTTTGRRSRGHLSHNSMSMPKPNVGTPQHASVARLGSHAGLDAAMSNVIYESGEHVNGKDSRLENGGSSCQTSSSQSQGVMASILKARNSAFGDVDQSSSDSPMSASSSLISPTLTYSTQTPSTLSPSTPFFGSFNNHMDGFEKMAPTEQATSIQCKPSTEAAGGVGVDLRA